MSSAKKPIILTNFGYQRKNWVYPLEAIKDDFEVVYIHYNRKSDETNCFTDSTVLYFTDFKNAQELIDKVQPNIFIAMGLNSNLVFAIKHVCNKRGLPFVYMDHGVYGLAKDYVEFEKTIKRKSIKSIIVNDDNNRTRNISFPIKTFIKSIAPFKIIAIFIKILFSRFSNKIVFQNIFQKYLAQPDAFLTYSKLNNVVNQQIYHPKEKEIYYIGNFEYDKFKKEPSFSEESYMLLIDSPLSDNPNKDIVFTTENHIRIYNKINSAAREKNLQLKIKLHPYNYNSDWIREIENVEFIKDYDDINSLIKNAKYCVSFYSTLLIPALYFVPTSVLKAYEHSFIRFLEENDLCFIYDIDHIENAHIEFKPILARQNIQFLENYFDLSKRPSTERLKLALNNLLSSSAVR